MYHFSQSRCVKAVRAVIDEFVSAYRQWTLKFSEILTDYLCRRLRLQKPAEEMQLEDLTWLNELSPDTFSADKYYHYLRSEIEREDGITNQRLTWAMTFQGFLIASMTFLLQGSWVSEPKGIEVFRKLAVGAIGLVGLLTALLTKSGIDASRDALDRVTSDWEKINSKIKMVPRLAPRPYGQGRPYFWGSLYARLMPRLFLFMWTVYFLVYLAMLPLFF
jgi:hypothetical protein